MNQDDHKVTLKPVDSLEAEPVVVLHNRETQAPQLTPAKEDVVRLTSPVPEKPTQAPLAKVVAKPSIALNPELLVDSSTPPPFAPEFSWENPEAPKKSFNSWGWFILLFAVLIAAASWSLHQIAHYSQTQTDQATQTYISTAQKQEQEANQRITLLETTIRNYLQASTPTDLLKYCRQPVRVAPLMADYYQKHPLNPTDHITIQGISPITLDLHSFFVVSVSMAGKPKTQLIAEETTQGTFKIDWEHHVNYQPIPWDSYVKSPKANTSLDFRVMVEVDNYYNYEFSDSSIWTCFKLSNPASLDPIFGYVKKGSTTEAQLLQTLQSRNHQASSFILRLLHPPDLKARNAVVIERVLSTSWILVTNPDSGT